MTSTKAWLLSLAALAVVAVAVVACQEVTEPSVKGIDLGDDCRLVGYVFGWRIAPNHEEPIEERAPIRLTIEEDATLLTEMLQQSIDVQYGELEEPLSSYCRDSALWATAAAVNWYWCREEPPVGFKAVLADYEERESRCMAVTPLS